MVGREWDRIVLHCFFRLEMLMSSHGSAQCCSDPNSTMSGDGLQQHRTQREGQTIYDER